MKTNSAKSSICMVVRFSWKERTEQKYTQTRKKWLLYRTIRRINVQHKHKKLWTSSWRFYELASSKLYIFIEYFKFFRNWDRAMLPQKTRWRCRNRLNVLTDPPGIHQYLSWDYSKDTWLVLMYIKLTYKTYNLFHKS